ncbi:MAG: hypothetical protein R3B09_21565 [Nannocystaceae bacterium]
MIARSPGRNALLPSLALVGLVAACPQRVAPEAVKAAAAGPGADDPRVVADTGELYAKGEAPSSPADPSVPAPGSGAPDETNGVCRLYAPKLARPECCPIDLGLDAATVQRACGHSLYLGESVHATCGYFFADDDAMATKPVSLRLSFALQATVKDAVKAHDERIAFRVANDPEFHSTPVPGIKDAYWSRHKHLRWAYLPGWSRPRLLSWNEETCSDEGILEVIRQLVAAPEVREGAPRRAKIPGGAPEPEPAAAG